MEVNNTSNTNSYEAYKNQATQKNKLGQDAFMKILSAQLQHQDPMSGGDNTQFIAQLAQFSALEQMENLNNSFTEMMKKQDILLGSQWIGKEVALYQEDGSISTGVVDGFGLSSSGIIFFINDKEYTLDQILAVREHTTDTESTNENPSEQDTDVEQTI